jgi:predicted ATPase
LPVIYSFFVSNLVAFNGDVVRDLAMQFLTLTEKQKVPGLLTHGHRVLGMSLTLGGDVAEGRAHLDRAVALYDAAEQRPLAMRFGVEAGASSFAVRALALWALGYPKAALADADRSVEVAREFGQAASLMYTLCVSGVTRICCGEYAAASAHADEVAALGQEKGTAVWGAWGIIHKGCVLALTKNVPNAVDMLTAAIDAYRSTGSMVYVPWWLSHLAAANADFGRFDVAWRIIVEAIALVDATKERWCEAEVHRTAGEIVLRSPRLDATQAEACFERALAIARGQQSKSWELRTAMSMARLWRDQGRPQQARELLAPVYGWFTEGHDTRDLKEAKALLAELAP